MLQNEGVLGLNGQKESASERGFDDMCLEDMLAEDNLMELDMYEYPNASKHKPAGDK